MFGVLVVWEIKMDCFCKRDYAGFLIRIHNWYHIGSEKSLGEIMAMIFLQIEEIVGQYSLDGSRPSLKSGGNH